VRGAAEVVYQPGFPLNDTIDENAGVLIVRNYFPQGSGNTAVFFEADVVRFNFNAAGELFCIWAFKGYRGRAFGRVGIGSPLHEVRSLFSLFYDSGDEMYYPDHELSPGGPSGIAFVAPEQEPSVTSVVGISVHDWGIMRRSHAG